LNLNLFAFFIYLLETSMSHPPYDQQSSQSSCKKYIIITIHILITQTIIKIPFDINAYIKLTQVVNLGGSLLSASTHTRYAMGISSPCSGACPNALALFNVEGEGTKSRNWSCTL